MNHFAAIIGEFLKSAIEADWWKKLPRQEQLQYIRQHRKTRLKPTSQSNVNQQRMNTIFKSVPREWKKEMIYKGIGFNSEVTQLSDALRSRQLLDAFGEGTQTIVGFKTGTPITDMKPEFMIKSSYENEKYNAYKITITPDGKQQVVSIFEPRQRYNRRRGGYTERKHDLRMSKIVDLLEDKAYTVFAVKLDTSRIELRQQRSDLSSTFKRRDVEKKLIKDAVKPIYNFYSDRLNSNLSKLQDVAVPEFDDVLSSEQYTGAANRIDTRQAATKKLVDNIAVCQDKLSTLSSAVNSFKAYQKLPLQDKSYAEDNYNRKEFMSRLNDLKDRFKIEKAVVVKSRCKEISTEMSTVSPESRATFQLVFDNASDLISEVGLTDTANKIKQLKESTLSNATTNEQYKTSLIEILQELSLIQYQQDTIIDSQRR